MWGPWTRTPPAHAKSSYKDNLNYLENEHSYTNKFDLDVAGGGGEMRWDEWLTLPVLWHTAANIMSDENIT